MLILGLKDANLDQKGPKMGGERFFQNPKPQFSKRRPSDKFLYQKKMNRVEDISQNIDFGPKRGKFGPKRARNGRGKIFPGLQTSIFQKKTIRYVTIPKISKIQ